MIFYLYRQLCKCTIPAGNLKTIFPFSVGYSLIPKPLGRTRKLMSHRYNSYVIIIHLKFIETFLTLISERRHAESYYRIA